MKKRFKVEVAALSLFKKKDDFSQKIEQHRFGFDADCGPDAEIWL